VDVDRHAGKVALVTGAGSGIGRATALRLAAEGATVFVNDLDTDAGRQTLELLGSESRHHFVRADVADIDQVDSMFSTLDEAVGRLDVLVCNAAVSRTPGDGRDLKDQRQRQRHLEVSRGENPTTFADHLIDMTPAGWSRMTAANLDSVFYCCRAGLRLMSRDKTPGAIVCVASIAAVSGMGPPHYAAAKAGVVGLVRSLAREVGARGIRINAIAPGPIDTPMMRSVPVEQGGNIAQAIPLGRVGQPDEAAAAISFLASKEASYITGAVLEVNGGLHIG
jgi:3-oxoacyl-[acyl-carrier protein] reductase